ncbi:MAG: tyrosine-type recombinase/integrase [Planctomycetes bacterium]|jgi:integrase|nr:tyrosine-type recombinase/integrase [Planctomycetota bacterium]
MAKRSRKKAKPSKPSKTYPLTAHKNGQWCKKIRGKIHYFGPWDAPQAAMENYLRVAEDLHAGRRPQALNVSPDNLLVKDVCNHYLTFQNTRMDGGEIGRRWFADMKIAIAAFAQHVGKNRLVEDLRPEDFQEFRQHIAKHGLSSTRKGGLGPDGLTRAITVIRGMFKYAYDMDLIDRPVKYGRGFQRPSVTEKRKARRNQQVKHGKRLFTVPQIRRMLDEASCPLKAMILLGLNGGYGNTDCARLPRSVLDLEAGVIEYDRPKTGIERVVTLWPETVEALRETLKSRPEPLDEETAALVFVTRFGRPWVREKLKMNDDGVITTVSKTDSIGQEFDKLLVKLDMKRPGLSFYALRHTFRTLADETRDQHAVHRIMGHQIPGMSGIYVEDISLDRLRAVTDHVRRCVYSRE